LVAVVSKKPWWLKRNVLKKLKGISILNGDVMDVEQNGIAGLDKWLSTDITPLKDSLSVLTWLNQMVNVKKCSLNFSGHSYIGSLKSLNGNRLH